MKAKQKKGMMGKAKEMAGQIKSQQDKKTKNIEEKMETKTTYAEMVKTGTSQELGTTIANIAIISACTNPGHRIDFYHVIPNLANGDCSFESVTDQLNNSRNSVANSDFSKCGAGKFEDPNVLRLAVAEDLKGNRLAQERMGMLDEPERYQREVEKLQVPGVWNVPAGDLVLPGIAFTTKKNILVYHTNPNNGFSPISVVSPSELGGNADSDISIVLAYSGSHYEGLVPNTANDVAKSIELVDAYIRGDYKVTAHDIPILRERLPVELQEERVLQLAIRESQLQRVREEELEITRSQLQQDKARELDIAIRQSQITAEKTAAEKDAADKADAVKAEAEKAAAEKAAAEKTAAEKTAAEKVDKEKSDAEMAAAEKAAAEKADAEKAAADKAAAEKAAAAKAAAEKAKAEKKLLHKKNRQARKSRQDRDESRQRGRKGQSNGQELNNDDKVAKLS